MVVQNASLLITNYLDSQSPCYIIGKAHKIGENLYRFTARTPIEVGKKTYTQIIVRTTPDPRIPTTSPPLDDIDDPGIPVLLEHSVGIPTQPELFGIMRLGTTISPYRPQTWRQWVHYFIGL